MSPRPASVGAGAHGRWRLLAALLALALSGCGAVPAVRWPDGVVGPITLPLVAVYGGPPPVVEVGLGVDARGQERRALCALDSTARDLRLGRALAAALDLSVSGNPARGHRLAVLPTLRLGPLDPRADGTAALGVEAVTLHDVPVLVVKADVFGRLADTAVSCVLGWSLWAEGALDLDPSHGVAHLWPQPPAVLPPDAEAHPLSRHGEGFGLAVTTAGQTSEPWRLAVGAARSHVAAEEAARLGLGGGRPVDEDGEATEPDPDRPQAAGWLAAVSVSGPPVPILLAAGAPEGLVGEVGADLLRDLRLRFEPGDGVLWTAPTPPGRGWLRRFPDLPDCGPLHARCLRGWIERVAPGRLWLRFEAPRQALPRRYWVQIDVGRVGQPFGALVRVDPKAVLPTATLEDPRIQPDTVRGQGAAVDVVDVVPLDQACQADACVRRY